MEQSKLIQKKHIIGSDSLCVAFTNKKSKNIEEVLSLRDEILRKFEPFTISGLKIHVTPSFCCNSVEVALDMSSSNISPEMTTKIMEIAHEYSILKQKEKAKFIEAIKSDKVVLEVYECTCGFHLGIDSTYLEQVAEVSIPCPCCGKMFITSKDDECKK